MLGKQVVETIEMATLNRQLMCSMYFVKTAQNNYDRRRKIRAYTNHAKPLCTGPEGEKIIPKFLKRKPCNGTGDADFNVVKVPLKEISFKVVCLFCERDNAGSG